MIAAVKENGSGSASRATFGGALSRLMNRSDVGWVVVHDMYNAIRTNQAPCILPMY